MTTTQILTNPMLPASLFGRPKTWATTLSISLQSSIKVFTDKGQFDKAFNAFSLLHHHGFPPNPHSLSSLIHACGTLKSLSSGKQLHAQIITLGHDHNNPLIITRLVTMYCKCGSLHDAHLIAQNPLSSDVIPWNVLIASYVRDGFFREAIDAYKQLEKIGVDPDNFTFPSVLKACGEESDLRMGREIHKCVERSCLNWSVFVHNSLVAMYAKCGEIKTARKVFDEMMERDVISWNAIIGGYAQLGQWNEAFQMFDSMHTNGLEANTVTWNTVLGGNVQTRNHIGALRLISHMRCKLVELDYVTLTIGLSACSHMGCVKLGKEIHASTIRFLFYDIETITNALITMYSRCGALDDAYILFMRIKSRSLITWNAMIAGYAHSALCEETSFLFREMVFSDYKPNFVTIASVLPLCARVANLQHGKELHSYIIKNKFEPHLLIWNSLVDMYAKSGRISESHKLFDRMQERDEVTYTVLIAGYGMQGKGNEALKLFNEMLKHKIKPDHITMVSVLSACSHSGLVAQGRWHFERMITDHGIMPRMEHYACMVDLFGRAGLLKEAEEIMKGMPFEPTSAMWTTLIGACRIHGNTEVGGWAAEKLLDMRPENPGYYVLIANMYAAAGFWDKLASVRIMMRDRGLRKAPGCTWIEVNNIFHPFLVGDTSNPQAREIYATLASLAEQMREAGYVANMDFAFDDGDE
ncbi:pentatricopeptide repeat-containing protein At1g71490 [Amborella trichopoda]|uniref:pentatricopeptide repeat-containing protein At1g71490 n=1 Tax=Amborella trichopoda TaxID=13333 RepID=UPI0009C031F1|nr:pentatricopeptide repeat-containing protein At1g71490 [Amborella trichopoda]|eukprot:XP_011620964.2 pentatricopeptide repeat-containing protein At1g71490 [Amborella trichopoda]